MYEGNAATVIGKCVGNYVIERTLAQGGMGSVFVARHPALGREAAVKFLGQDLDAPPELTQRFLDEARITANLRHPNIVDIFDFGELDGRLYYVMELLEGRDLAQVLQAVERIGCDEALDYLEPICSGLAAAHAVGVVHRDLKPANVFVSNGDPPRVKLMDFGVAKILKPEGEHTRYGQIIGTPRYMSPEQALGQVDRISPQSDLYSLGIIAYEMLAGSPPFEHDSPMMLLVMHVRDEVRPLRDVVPDVQESLAALIHECLSKDPNERPASALEVLNRIAAIRRESGTRTSRTASCRTESSRAESSRARIPEPSTSTQERDRSAVTWGRFADADTILGEPARPISNPAVDRALDLLKSPRSQADGPEQAETKVAEAPPVHAPVRPGGAAVALEPTALPTASSATPVPVVPEALALRETATASPAPAAPETPAPPRLSPLPVVASPVIVGPSTEAGPASIQLTESDRTTMNKLLARMQRRGDFPAFVQNVGEVSKRADFESSYSAQQLGTSILKDYALTAKLLRIVNSSYAHRFGGRIYSVQHAIVILGFERVRALALSTSLFKTQPNKEHSDRITESAINSLVSGEIARLLYAEADIDDPEQATVCAMFRNLGKHLVLVYLPELYDQIVSMVQRDGVTLNQAAERVLGISLHKLGVGVAERWRLPSRMISAMSVVPERNAKPKRPEDKLAALAEFSNQICEIMTNEGGPDERSAAIRALLGRTKHLMDLPSDDASALLQATQESFEKRYASVLGAAAKQNRFSQAVATYSGEKSAEPANPVILVAQPEDPVTVAVEQRPGQPIQPPNARERHGSPGVGGNLGKERSRPQVARLQLARPLQPEVPSPVAEGAKRALDEPVRPLPPEPSAADIEAAKRALDQHEAAALTEFEKSGGTEASFQSLLAAVSKFLSVPRILALRAAPGRRELVVVGGSGDDVDGLAKEFRIPLAAPRTAIMDPFSQSLHSNRDFFFEDTFAAKATAQLPQRYYEAIGSSALAILSCHVRNAQPLLLAIDVEPPTRLPAPESIALLGSVRQTLARTAPGA